VPNLYNPQSLNRFSYVRNNPLRYTDPTGHMDWEGDDGGCYPCTQLPNPDGSDGGGQPPLDPTESEMIEYIASFGITLQGNWTGTYLANLWETLFTHIGYKELVLWLNGKKVILIIGGAGNNASGRYSGWTSGSSVTFYANNTTNPVINMLHEFGHLVDNLWGDYFTNELNGADFYDNRGDFLAGWNGTAYTSLPSSYPVDVRSLALISSNVGGGDAWQQRGGTPNWEDWGDIFANAMIDNINQASDLGGQMNNFFVIMESHVTGGIP